MNRQLLLNLSEITQEEKEILAGHRQIDRALYYNPSAVPARQNEIDSSLVLENGKMIDIRRHVRFVHFPRHTHNFVEFVYMCQGSTTHIIDGRQITLNAGDFLFLNQHATQEILPCGRDDIAVNFMILPQFFGTAFRMLGNTESSLRSFLISCLTDKNTGGNYLYFNVSGILPIQNLAENLICTMLGDSPQKRLLSETTMGLLFLHLTDGTDSIRAVGGSYEENLMIRLLSYIENNYQSASLTSLSIRLTDLFCEGAVHRHIFALPHHPQENREDLYSSSAGQEACAGRLPSPEYMPLRLGHCGDDRV